MPTDFSLVKICVLPTGAPGDSLVVMTSLSYRRINDVSRDLHTYRATYVLPLADAWAAL